MKPKKSIVVKLGVVLLALPAIGVAVSEISKSFQNKNLDSISQKMMSKTDSPDYVAYESINFNSGLDSDFTGGTLSSGNYYLKENLTFAQNITIAEGDIVNICLNGFSLDMHEWDIVNNGKLGIYDNGENNTTSYFSVESSNYGLLRYYNSGTPQPGNASVEGSCLIRTHLNNSGILSLYDVKLYGFGCRIETDDYSNDGDCNAITNLFSGSMSYCSTSSSCYVIGGTLNMFDEFTIDHCISTNGTVYCDVDNEDPNNSVGVFNMYGGNIKYNLASCTGGGVYCEKGTFNMYGGKIWSNFAGATGGGVQNAEGLACFHMYGGEIYKNRALGAGAGVFNTTGIVTLEGKCIINDNYVNDEYEYDDEIDFSNDVESNLFTMSSVTVTGELKEGSNIGLSTDFDSLNFALGVVDSNGFGKKDFFDSDINNFALTKITNRLGNEYFALSKISVNAEPTYNNSYKFDVSPLNGGTMTYEWHDLRTYNRSEYLTEISAAFISDFSHYEIPAALYSGVHRMKFENVTYGYVSFLVDSLNSDSDDLYCDYDNITIVDLIKVGTKYFVYASVDSTAFTLMSDSGAFSIYDLKFYDDEVVSGFTSSSLSGFSPVNKHNYYCVATETSTSYTVTSRMLQFSTVTFNINGEAGTTPSSVTKTVGEKLTLPDNTLFPKKGYTFNGWKINDTTYAPGYEYDFTDSNITLTASFSVITHTDSKHSEYTFNKPLTNSFTGGELTSGNYYLFEDITLTSDISIPQTATVRICLNGHVLNMGGDHSIYAQGSLYIYDCNDTISHKFSINNTTGVATLDNSGSTIVYGGLITGFQATGRKALISLYGTSGGEDFIFSSYDNQHLDIDGVVFIGNTLINTISHHPYSSMRGLIMGNSVTLSNTKMMNNVVSESASGGHSISQRGGFVSALNCLTLNNVEFKDNKYYLNADGTENIEGGLCFSNSSIIGNNVVATGNTITNDATYAYSTLKGGLFFTASGSIQITNGELSSNEVCGRGFNGGLIYSNSSATLSGVDILNNDISSPSGNPITCKGGLIYAAESINLDEDSIIANNDVSYIIDLAGGLLYSSKSIYVDETVIHDNQITSTIIDNKSYTLKGGLVHAEVTLEFTDSNIYTNTVSYENSSNIYGGFLSSNNSGLTFKNSNFYSNTLNVNNNVTYTKTYIYGGFIYANNYVDFDNANFYSNELYAEGNVHGSYGGLMMVGAYNGTSTINDVEMHDNEFSYTNIEGNGVTLSDCVFGFLGSGSSINLSATSFKVYDNSASGDIYVAEGFVRLLAYTLEDVEIYNNEIVSQIELKSNSDQCSGVFVKFDNAIELLGKIVVYDNTINGKQSNLNFSDESYSNITDTSLLDAESKIGLSYFKLDDVSCALVVKGGKDFINSDIFFADDKRFILECVDDDIYIRGRIDEHPSSGNNFNFVVDESQYSGTLSYQWYRKKSSGDIALSGNTNPVLNTSAIVFGNYYCVASGKVGNNVDFAIRSNSVKFSPSVLTQPSVSNEYFFEVDKDKCEENDVTITYEWYEVIASQNSLKPITDDDCTILTTSDVASIIGSSFPTSGTYNVATHAWNFEDNTLLAIEVELDKGDVVEISKEGYSETQYMVVYAYYDDGDVDICGLGEYGFTLEAPETTTYYFLIMIEDEDLGYVGGNVSIGIVPEAASLIDQSKVTLYSDSEIAELDLDESEASVDGDTYSVTDNGGLLSVNLEAGDTIRFRMLDALEEEGLFAIIHCNDFGSIVGYYEAGAHVAYTALQSGKYYVQIYTMDFDEGEPITGSFAIDLYSNETLNKVVGQTDDKYHGDDAGNFIGKAIYDDGSETCTLSSSVFEYVPYTVTYNIGDATGTAPVDDYNYALNGKATVKSIGSVTKGTQSFLGWSINSDGTGTLYNAGDKITVTDGLTLYAVWQEKEAIELTLTSQSYTFGNNNINFNIVGSTLSSFTVKYYVDSEWTTVVPANAGSYNVKIYRAEDDTYQEYNAQVTNGLVITKAKVNEPTVNGAYTYNGNAQTVSFTGKESYMTTEDALTNTNAGSYVITFTLDDNHEWDTGSDGQVTWNIAKANAVITTSASSVNVQYGQSFTIPTATSNFGTVAITQSSSSISDVGTHTITYTVVGTDNYNGATKTITVTISKANANISVDQTHIVITFGQTLTLPTASTNVGTVTCDTRAADLVNAGSYEVKYTVNATNNYNGDTKIVCVTIEKAVVNEPTVVGTYEYTGAPQTVTLSGVEDYMSTTSSLSATEVGIYTIVYSLDNNHEWSELSDGKVVWMIGNTQKFTTEASGSEQALAQIEIKGLTDPDVTFETESLSEEDINDQFDEYLDEDETGAFGFVSKLNKYTRNQKSEVNLADVTTQSATIWLKIPEGVNINTIKKIIHIYGDGAVEDIGFDRSKVTEDRYYMIEVTALDNFIFVCGENEQFSFDWRIILIIAAICFVAGIVATVVIVKGKKDKPTIKAPKVADISSIINTNNKRE